MNWTEDLKIQFQNSLDALKDALGSNFREHINRSRNVCDEFDRFKSMVENNIGNNYDLINELGYDILTIYYFQNKNNNNAFRKSLDEYSTEHSIVIDISNFLDELNPNVADPPGHPGNGRRWQTHPIYTSRKDQGFYDNLVKELKETVRLKIKTI